MARDPTNALACHWRKAIPPGEPHGHLRILYFLWNGMGAYGLRFKPSWWHTARWGTVLLGAGFGAFFVLLLAALGATVRLSRTHFHYKGIRGGLYSWSDFSNIQCVHWRGLLRITLEVPAGAGPPTQSVVVAAPARREADIEFILKATGKLVAGKPEPTPWSAGPTEPGEKTALHRSLTGTCSTCGYSLTGNTSRVCPECGTPIVGKAGVDG